LGNRRRYELWAADLQRAEGATAPVAVALADLDRFKAVNDTFGHLIGDTVLSITARRLRSAAGDSDTVVRWGGEEFLLLRTGAGCQDIAAIGERMRRAVAESPMAVGVDHTIAITISVGCAVGVIADLVPTLETADRALYAAKRQGRNKVVVNVGYEPTDDVR
jgi:diguanylate cyclase (GGDEF)-like protein